MDTILITSFLPIFPQSKINVSSSVRNVKKPRPMIASNSFFNTFQSIKKLLTHYSSSTHKDFKKSLTSNQEIIFNSLDKFICTYLDSRPLRPTIDPKHVLSGWFAPVEELPPTECEVVEGSLLGYPCLEGVYIRNSLNPQFIPRGPYHVFDGDGMLHSINISQGKAIFCSRYVKTYKYMVEREIEYQIFPSVFASFNGFIPSMARCVLFAARILTGQINPIIHGTGGANTSLTLIGGKLFALEESDLPYAIKVTSEGDIITLGRHDFHSKQPFMRRMTAHPKTDQITGETFAYKYDVARPFLTFFRIDSVGRKQEDVPILSKEISTVVHDFGITKNYAIFPEIQILLNPMEIVRGKSPVIVDPTKIPRLGIIPKYAEDDSEMWWIDVPGLNILHVVNSWDEDGGDTIVMVASNYSSVEQAWVHQDPRVFTIKKIIINVKSKTFQNYSLSTKILDLATINPAYSGKKCRYVYSATIEIPEMSVGVVKLDLSKSTGNFCADCIVASRFYGSGCVGGEPIFVPKDPNNPEAEEDDGYLITYITDENSEESKFIVMDAKSPTLEIVVSVKLPQRVPAGFHGIFVPSTTLNKLYTN